MLGFLLNYKIFKNLKIGASQSYFKIVNAYS